MQLRFIGTLALTLCLSACLEVTTEPGVTQQCTTTGFTSRITFLVSSVQDLPPVLSGQINDTVSFDECQGRDTFLYTIDRTASNQAQVSIWLPEINKGFDQYFDENNQPKADPLVRFKFFGRTYCDDDAIILSQGAQELNWQPLYTEKTGCPQAGYSAIVQ